MSGEAHDRRAIQKHLNILQEGYLLKETLWSCQRGAWDKVTLSRDGRASRLDLFRYDEDNGCRGSNILL